MPENPATAFIDALKAKLNCTSDEELSQKLRLGKSTLASWRIRGRVPKNARDSIHVDYGVDYDLITNNDKGAERLIHQQIQTAFFITILRLGRHVKEDNFVELASWIAQNDHLIRNFFMGDFEKQHGIIYHHPEQFTQMLLRVARGEQGAPDAILAFKRQWDEQGTTSPEFPT